MESELLRTPPLGKPHFALRRISAVSTQPVLSLEPPNRSQGEVALQAPPLPTGLAGGHPFSLSLQEP